MDRGFGSFRGNNDRDRYSRDERRYDNFYDNNRRAGGNQNRNMNANNRAGPRNNPGNWSGTPRDRGFGQGNMRDMQYDSQTRRSGMLQNLPHRYKGNRGGGMGGRGPNRPGDKRRMEQSHSSVKRSRPAPTNRKTTPTKTEKKEVREPSPDIPDDEVVIPDSLMDAVETLRQRKEIERNVADEDIKKLCIFSYTGKGYYCQTCGLFLSKEAGFIHHLNSKTHVMNVIEMRTAKKYQSVRDILDIDLSPDDWYEKSEKARSILHKQAKALMKSQRETERRERENYEKNPGNFFNVKMETKKTAHKKEDTVTITSIVESTIEIKDFAKDRFFGCEFVKAVTGFQCRLCNIHIKDASQVIPHVDGKVHRNNYQAHLNKNKGYEDVQREQNKELMDVLTEHEEQDVLLFETKESNEMKFLAKIDPELIREERLLNPPKKEEKKDEEKEGKEGEEGDADKEKSEEKNEGEEEQEGDQEDKEEEKSMEEEEEEKSEEKDEENEEQEELEKGDDEVHENGNTEEEIESQTTEEGDGATEEEEETLQEEDVEMKDEAQDETEEKVEEKKPKSAIKKPPSNAKTKTPTPTRRGRGRGAKGSGTRSRRSKGKEEVAADEKPDDSTDSSFLDAFHVVDEVVEDY